MWALLYEKKRDIVLVSATGSLAEECLRKIKSELEGNELITKDFGDIQSAKWTEAHIILKSGCQARAKGAGYQIRGFRPDCIIVDDVETDEAVRSADQREKLEDWFWKALVNTLEPDQQLIVVGTILHPLSFLNTLIEKPKPTWWVKKYKAIKDDGTPLWKEKWPLEKLEARKIEIGEKRFRSEFMNDPLADSDTVFDIKWIDSNSVDNPPKMNELWYITAVDPAVSKKDLRDYTAILTIGIHRTNGHIYVVEAKRGRWSPYETVDQILETYKRFSPKKVLIEAVQYQAALRDILLKEAREKEHLYIPVRQVVPDMDKVRRANNVSHMVEQGAVHILKHQEDLRNELMLFPSADHDDLVDVFVYCLSEVNNGEANIQKQKISGDQPSFSLHEGMFERAKNKRSKKSWSNY